MKTNNEKPRAINSWFFIANINISYFIGFDNHFFNLIFV